MIVKNILLFVFFLEGIYWFSSLAFHMESVEKASVYSSVFRKTLPVFHHMSKERVNRLLEEFRLRPQISLSLRNDDALSTVAELLKLAKPRTLNGAHPRIGASTVKTIDEVSISTPF